MGRGLRQVPQRPHPVGRGVAQGPGERALPLQVQRPGAAAGGEAAAERRRGGRRGAAAGREARRAGVRAGRQPHRHRGAVGRRGAPAALHAAPAAAPPLPGLRLPLHPGPGGQGAWRGSGCCELSGGALGGSCSPPAPSLLARKSGSLGVWRCAARFGALAVCSLDINQVLVKQPPPTDREAGIHKEFTRIVEDFSVSRP